MGESDQGGPSGDSGGEEKGGGAATPKPLARQSRKKRATVKSIEDMQKCIVAGDISGLNSLLAEYTAAPVVLVVCVVLPKCEECAKLVLAQEKEGLRPDVSLAGVVLRNDGKVNVLKFLRSAPVSSSSSSASSSLTCNDLLYAAEYIESLGSSTGFTCFHYACANPWSFSEELLDCLATAAALAQNRNWGFTLGSKNMPVPIDFKSSNGSSGRGGRTLLQNQVGSLSPLHVATSQGNLAAVEALLKLGVDVHISDSHGWDGLHWSCSPPGEKVAKPVASMSAQAACAALLLSVAPELFDAVDKKGQTALDWATHYVEEGVCDRKVLDVLLKHKSTCSAKKD
jgi:hypothetical protein